MSNVTAVPETYFPRNYREGRAAFIAAAQACGLGVTSRLLTTHRGRNGGPLFIDTATIGERTAPHGLLLISGTHGVEGYFGSGVQTGLLRENLADRIPAGVRLVLLHALNPYGFSFDRRVNEDNADVNRNFVDHAAPPENPEYDALAEDAAPKNIAPETFKTSNARLKAYAERHGAMALQAALSCGQYRHADGIYYGGARLSWSVQMLADVLREELRGIETLTVIDFHTGLGESGAAEIISEAPSGSAALKRAEMIWGTAVTTTAGGTSLSAHLHGTIDSAMVAFMGERPCTFVALEVGTAPAREVFDALRKDNWLHCHASLDHPQADDIKRAIRAAFYPDTPEWKRAVWNHGVTAVEAALAHLGAL